MCLRALVAEGGPYPQSIPRSRGSGSFARGVSRDRLRQVSLITMCIDRERFFFMNEPAHSWLQLSAQSEVIPHLNSSPLTRSFNRMDYGGTKCISRCSVIVACPVHDFLTRFPNFSDPFDITPNVE
jgi:hypothetical protein